MGNGAFGRLGLGDQEDRWKPTKIETLCKAHPGLMPDEDKAFITRVDAGYTHSVAVSSKGAVYTFGCGALGKLGHGDW